MKEKNAQVSLEYLLVIAVFFSALLIIIPSISNASQQLLVANDTILAKQISDLIQQEDNMFSLLADGSSKQYEFIPSNYLKIKMKNNTFEISSKQKAFLINLNSVQVFAEQEFSSKFIIQIKKEKNQTTFILSKLQS